MTGMIPLGATYLGADRTSFLVWAPLADEVSVRITFPEERELSMERDGRGYHRAMGDGLGPGSLYYYRLDNRVERPDPASRFQPQGVHGPSQVVDGSFDWNDRGWKGVLLGKYVIYELHVGTYTHEGTFDAVIPHLDELKELGITALELMPVAQFPGARNWGYDGVYPYAVQNSYGGPEGLKRLVDACHGKGLAVILDVVYNHLGPEGNYVRDFGPYFTDVYTTPWGAAINFDGPGSDDVRRFFIDNALYWLEEFHVDALRLDAVHAILDRRPRSVLTELSGRVNEMSTRLGRYAYLIAESSDNNPCLITSTDRNGEGMDAQWNDDFHHSLHSLLTGEQGGYYADYGRLEHLAKSFREGFVYSGEYSTYRDRSHGLPSRDVPAERFVVCAQNHDQIGNRLLGERLPSLVSFESLKLAAGLVIFSPFIPLLFMGEEYGETAPFQYFIDHSDPELIGAVRRGRRREFAAFSWDRRPPDPQARSAFERSVLHHGLKRRRTHRALVDFYREALRLRRSITSLAFLDKETLDASISEPGKVLVVRRWSDKDETVLVANFADTMVRSKPRLPKGRWEKVFDSAEEQWNGLGTRMPASINAATRETLPMTARSIVLYRIVKQ